MSPTNDHTSSSATQADGALSPELRQVIAQLTANAVRTLDMTHESMSAAAPGGDVLIGSTYTGLGKWTTLASIGVRNNLRVTGCVEDVGTGGLQRLTPLGKAVVTCLHESLPEALAICRRSTRRGQ